MILIKEHFRITFSQNPLVGNRFPHHFGKIEETTSPPGDSTRDLLIYWLEVTYITFEFGSRNFHHPKKVTNSQNCQAPIYIYIPGTCLSSILRLKPSKTRSFPTKTRVIWVPGIYPSPADTFSQFPRPPDGGSSP